VGTVASFDNFYTDRPDIFEKLARYGVLAVEMEAAGLYTLAARFGVKALAITTISDHILHNTQTTSEERERSLVDMVRIALQAIVSDARS
jgi:purine-nucleoside phosphorylase